MRALALASISAALTVIGCPPPSGRDGPRGPAPSAPTEARFDALLDTFILGTPSDCRNLGMHAACDGRVADYSKKGIQGRIATLHSILSELERSRPAEDAKTREALDRKLDHQLLEMAVKQELFRVEGLGLWKKRPQFYEELFSLDGYLVRDYAPLDDRARALLKHVNAALEQTAYVVENIEGPMPRAFVETDIGIYKGYAEYLRGDVVKLLEGVKDADLRRAAIGGARKLADRAEEIAQHLSKNELPRADDSFALGAAKYRELLRVQEALDQDLDSLMQLAEKDLARNLKAYDALASKGVNPSRPSAFALLDVARNLTTDARAFIAEKGLMTIPEAGKLAVAETPPFMRWNSAFLNGTGPFDRADLTSYYYITLPDPAWSKAEQDDYIMPYGTLLATSVHEVFPGHFLQGLAIRSAPTRAQKMLASYSFVEGWAHYGEQLMIEQGFGARDPQNALGQLGDALLRNCRFVVSIGIHTKGMTLAEAERRFVEDCKQDKATARQQALRGTFDPGYFAYTLGKIQILALRDEAQKKLGASFDLKRFHDALLSHGSPPVPLIHDRVLAEIGAK